MYRTPHMTSTPTWMSKNQAKTKLVIYFLSQFLSWWSSPLEMAPPSVSLTHHPGATLIPSISLLWSDSSPSPAELPPKLFPNPLAAPSIPSPAWCQTPVFLPQQAPYLLGWGSWLWSCPLKEARMIFLKKHIRSCYESHENHLMLSQQSSLCLPANVSFRLSSPWFLSSCHAALFWIFKCTEVTPALELLYLHSPFSEKLFSHIFAWWHPGHSDFSWLWPLRMPFLTTLSENPLPPASLRFSIITHVHTWCSRVYLFETPAAPKLHSSRYLVCCVHGCIVCAQHIVGALNKWVNRSCQSKY